MKSSIDKIEEAAKEFCEKGTNTNLEKTVHFEEDTPSKIEEELKG